MRTLFVCLGNVARSQMAEGFYNHYTKSKDAHSAGTLDYTPEKYGTPVMEVVEVMKEEGIDVSQHKVEFITPEKVDESDRIFIMCTPEQCPDFLRNSEKVTFWTVEDPDGKSADFFRTTRDTIKKKVRELLELGP